MYMVMSATTLDGKSNNRARCFELNATNIPTKAEAETEAVRRNLVERSAGHNNVEWYACWQMPPIEELMKLPRDQWQAAMQEPT